MRQGVLEQILPLTQGQQLERRVEVVGQHCPQEQPWPGNQVGVEQLERLELETLLWTQQTVDGG